MTQPSLSPYNLGKTNPRADFRPDEFRKFIFNHGLQCLWEQAAQCPCQQKTRHVAKGFDLPDTLDYRTGASRKDCPLCFGRGWFWHSPTETVALFTSGADNPAILAMGEAGRGMTAITALPENLPAFKDRFTLRDSVMIMREGRSRGAQTVEALRYPVALRPTQTEDGEFLQGVRYAHKSNPDGTVDVAGQLVENEDFVVTDDGKLDWALGIASGRAPALNEWYTITYFHNPRFVVDNLPHGWRDTRILYKNTESTVVPMPVHAMGKLEHMGEGRADG